MSLTNDEVNLKLHRISTTGGAPQRPSQYNPYKTLEISHSIQILYGGMSFQPKESSSTLNSLYCR